MAHLLTATLRRYFAKLEGEKAGPTNYVTCCESQGTRTFGALPEFVYSTSVPSGDPSITVYVNLMVPSVYQGNGFKIVQSTGFPSNGTISIAMHRDPIDAMHHDDALQQVMLRIPSWCHTETVSVTVRANYNVSALEPHHFAAFGDTHVA